MHNNLLLTLGLTVGLLVPALSQASDVFEDLFPYEYNAIEGEFKEGKKWQEEKLFLPEFPKDGNLIEFTGPPGINHYTYSIDEESLKVGKDGIVRYVVVIASNSGSRNIYYQGLSCSKQRLKQYAYADMEKQKFIAMKEPQWQGFRRTGALGYSDNLYSFYFCNHVGQLFSRKQIIDKLKYGHGDLSSDYDY